MLRQEMLLDILDNDGADRADGRERVPAPRRSLNVGLEEKLEALIEVVVFGHVSHEVLALIVQVSRCQATNQALIFPIRGPSAHVGNVFVDLVGQSILLIVSS